MPDLEYGTKDYYYTRTLELEKNLNKMRDKVAYYQDELAKAHELLGRIVHQTSERWDSVRLTKYFPTNNLYNRRKNDNPKGIEEETINGHN